MSIIRQEDRTAIRSVGHWFSCPLSPPHLSVNLCLSLTRLVTGFRERAAFLDHTVRGTHSPPHTSRAPGFKTQDHAQGRPSIAAPGNNQEVEATLAKTL